MHLGFRFIFTLLFIFNINLISFLPFLFLLTILVTHLPFAANCSKTDICRQLVHFKELTDYIFGGQYEKISLPVLGR